MPIQHDLGTSNQPWKDSEDMLLSQCQVSMKIRRHLTSCIKRTNFLAMPFRQNLGGLSADFCHLISNYRSVLSICDN